MSKNGDNNLFADERLLKTLPVFSSERLSKTTLVLIHDKYSDREASNTIQNLENCQGKLEMKSGRIEKLRVRGDKIRGSSVRDTMINYL
jgi:hypothetical protein